MKWLNCDRMKLVVVGIVVGIVFGGGRAKADFTFGEPVNLGPIVNSSSSDLAPNISSDGLSLYFDSRRSDGFGHQDIWVTTRETIDDDWGAPVNLGPPVNTNLAEGHPHISADGLELYLGSARAGRYGGWDIWVTTRQTKDDSWGEVTNLGPLVNRGSWDDSPSISPDGLELYFTSYPFNHRPGGYGSNDIWVSRRETRNDPWEEAVNLGPIVNSTASEACAFLSSDGLLLLFSDLDPEFSGLDPEAVRPGGFGKSDIWVTRRTSVSDPWSTPVNLGPIINTSSHENYARVSPDGSILYFSSDRPGGIGDNDIWQAPIITIVDFNGDGIVDAADMCIMVDNWGTDNSLCDIGPMPWGDGVVDVEDLIFLAEHLFKEVNDPTLIAHWPLDEAEGIIAADSVSETGYSDGIVIGDPVWLPTGGQVEGALQLDGVDDYIFTNPVLNPADGAFSVFTWIKGGAPGQAIISQTDGDGAGETWLGTDAISGNLMTGLIPKKTGWVTPRPLVSESVITGGQWHHVGFVWDGSYRALYIDGVEVAKDTAAQNPLKSADGGLYIGASKDLDATSFFSGLIDDIRIYNRVVSP